MMTQRQGKTQLQPLRQPTHASDSVYVSNAYQVFSAAIEGKDVYGDTSARLLEFAAKEQEAFRSVIGSCVNTSAKRDHYLQMHG